MNLIDAQISEIKNLNLIYIFTTDNIFKDKTNKYVGAKVVFENNRTLSLDYKDSHFENFLKKLIERYNKEKDKRNIILLGDLTKKIMNDEVFSSLGEEEKNKSTFGLSLFNTKNFELKKYESYLCDTLEKILKITKSYEVVTIDKIDGYNNKFVVYYHVGSVKFEMRMIISFRDENHLDFQIGNVDGININIKGTIDNNLNNVTIYWESKMNNLSGKSVYDSINQTTEKKVLSNNQTIDYNDESEIILDEDLSLVKFYLGLCGIVAPKNIIKTSNTNFMLGEEEIINHVKTELFYKNIGCQLCISANEVIIRYQIKNALSKYNNQLMVALDKQLYEITFSKIKIDKDDYILVEKKSTNDFGSTYEYKVLQVESFDFTKPFMVSNELAIEIEIKSLYDVKRYIKKQKGEN